MVDCSERSKIPHQILRLDHGLIAIQMNDRAFGWRREIPNGLPLPARFQQTHINVFQFRRVGLNVSDLKS